MLPSANRISEKRDFEKIKKEGKLLNGIAFSISYIKTSSDKPSRFGITVSTVISKRATIRNKSKRAIREGIRQNLSFLNPGFDCVFLAKPIIVKRYTDEVMREVKEILTKAKIVR